MINVLFVTSEAAPFVSTGGLGEVSGSLPREVNKTGCVSISVVLPMYLSVKQKYYEKTEPVLESTVDLSWRKQYLGVRKIENDGVTFYFIDNEYYFGREIVYGNYDDGERFAYFGKAVIALIRSGFIVPDILHANDWQSALSVVYLKTQFPELSDIRCVFTVHNIAYQGKYDPSIAEDVFGFSYEEARVLLFDGDLNLIKGALCVSDFLTTVSPSYARELTDGYYAYGLENVIRNETDGIHGITNGLDDSYDPLTDPLIPDNYSSDNVGGKKSCREKLCREFCIENDKDRPIISMVTRLSRQKGIDLVMRVAEEMVHELGMSLVVLGTGETEYEGYFRSLSDRLRDKVGYIDRFDNSLARLVYAGADMFLMPSLYEPCGISQLTALKYGAVPIVRETGGLKDTVIAYNQYTDEGNGFSFSNYDAYEMKKVIGYAVSVFRNRNRWNGLMRRAMKSDNGWKRSAEEYVRIYKKITR